MLLSVIFIPNWGKYYLCLRVQNLIDNGNEGRVVERYAKNTLKR